MITYINGQFVQEENAMLQVGDLSIQRGFAVFDYFRTRNNVPLFLEDYIARFRRSASALDLQPIPTADALDKIIRELIDLNKVPESGFRMILTGGYSPNSFVPATANFIIIQQPLLLPHLEHFDKGISIMLHEYMRDLPEVKSTNYLMGVWLQKKLLAKKADEVLYHNNGFIFEFPRSNVFIVTQDQVVVTPKDNVLKGVTRKKVLEVASKNFKVEERNITVDELRNAQEVFATSTTKRILPVFKVDDITIADGKAGVITTQLYHDFIKLEEAFVTDEVDKMSLLA